MDKINKILVILICLSSELSFSQNFTSGVMFGIGTSQVEGDLQKGYNKAGLKVGGFVCYHFQEKTGLKIDFIYAGKGAKKNADIKTGNYDSFKTQLNYLELPVRFYWKIMNKFSIKGGLYAAYLVKANLSDQNGSIDASAYQINTMDYGISLGVEYSIMNQLSLNFDFEYSAASITQETLQPNWFNNAIALTLEYKFRK